MHKLLKSEFQGHLARVVLILTLVGGVLLAETGTASAGASRAAYSPYKEIVGSATCETYFDANWQPFHRMVAVSTPTMYSTLGRTYRVSWRPVLYRWSNGRWNLDRPARPSMESRVSGRRFRPLVASLPKSETTTALESSSVGTEKGSLSSNTRANGCRAMAKLRISMTRTVESISGRRRSATGGAT